MNSYPIGWRRMESRMKYWRSLHYYTENILLYTLYTIKLKIYTQRFYCNILLPNFQSLFKHSQPHGACTVLTLVWEEFLSVALWKPLSEGQSDGPLSPSDIHPSSNPKQLMLSDVSLLAVSNVNNPVGLVVLPYVMWSAHFFVTHTQTEKISSWNGPTVHFCCFMLPRASTKTFVSRIHIR